MNHVILVVDDNSINLKLACDVLAGEGRSVLSAKDAEHALAIIGNTKPDLILMDISMPGMDGLTLTRKLKSDPNTKDIVIVALTASAMMGDEARVMAAGCDGYVAKPIDTRTFSERIENYLAARPKKCPTVLVVDDVPANRKLLRALLESEGLVIIEAQDGVEAMRRLEEHAIDAIISDLLMPRMDGYRLCVEVRNSERFKRIPILIYTSTYTAVGDQQLALHMGADRYLIKPAPSGVILGAIHELLERPRPNRNPLVECDDELVLMKEYNQRLVEKLEERNLELTQLTQDLQAAHEKTRYLLRHSPAVLYGLKLDGQNIQPTIVSDNITELTGFSVAESSSFEWWAQQLHPDDKQRAIASLADTIKLGSTRTEYRIRHKDGNYRFVEDSRRVIRDSSGAPAEIVGVWSDISDRKRAEEALRDSEAKFRQFAENVQEVFWMTTPDFSKILYVSPAYEKVWARSAARLYEHPKDWIDAILPEDQEHTIGIFSKLFEGENVVSVEYRIRLPDGATRWIFDRGFAIRDEAGRLLKIAGIATDVTERKRLKDGLRRSQKMEAIGQLAGGIAHDFNNILACAIGYTELAIMDAEGNDGLKSTLQQVLDAGHRAKELVRQILTFSRQQEPERKPIKLQPVVGEALKLLRASLPSTIEIESNLSADAPTVLADATQIHQIILNLATNAAHAMKGRGKLNAHLTTVEIDAHSAQTLPDLRAGSYAKLSISDNGCGMDPQTLQHMFEPFFTTKPQGEGTGLGLAVVHGIVKSHDGAVSVYSELGKGTSFDLYFPAVLEASVDTIAPALPMLPGQGEHILVVDDEPSLALLCQRILEHAGYRVTICTSSSEALAEFRLAPGAYDMVITDLTMPNMNGADLAGEMLHLRPDLPIVLATGFGGAMTPAKAQALGIREVLTKPATARSLTECTHRVLSKKEVP